VTMEGTRAEIEERAVPFRVGEEVHVTIVEPHMYNPDDGVAKIDGYLITVAGGIGFVGDKKLVRIEQAGRTNAVASLTGPDAEAAEAAAVERAAERKKSEERARRSAAAKRGAASRKARESAKADATRTLADDDVSGADAGTAPAAVEEAAEDGALSSSSRRRGRRGGRRRSRAKASE
jgi:ribonuclease G